MRLDSVDLHIIAESGQCFRWQPIAEKTYLIHRGQGAACFEQVGKTELICQASFGPLGGQNHEASWYDYFHGDMDYKALRDQLVKEDSRLAPIIDASEGLRILKQDPLEMIITFMMSANNHIPRIKQFVHQLSKGYGTPVGTFKDHTLYGFPTLEQLGQMTEANYRALGAGYRSRYFESTVKTLIASEDFDQWHLLSDEDLLARLKGLMGVGQKVAECIALFGYGRWNSFPVDTWIKRIAEDWLPQEALKSEKLIREAFYQRYGKNRGLVQQYFFYYYRNLGGKP